MKSFIKIALLVFYVFFNAGLSYSMHYCGGDFQRVNVFAEYKTCCEDTTPMQGCCDDVSNLELPNTEQQLSTVLNFQPFGFDHVVPALKVELSIIINGVTERTAFADSSSPILHNTPIYIFCQVFLI
ncbi:HYC_CC_PP family protein [Belliella buryatensis]|uniref:HYC_CC_PP family protein n=1 Tax=Belliella buryatensis TaxID=1500549 RepID=UPI000B78F86E|nr:hypothetical protein [Belliella buryatensis]